MDCFASLAMTVNSVVRLGFQRSTRKPHIFGDPGLDSSNPERALIGEQRR